MTTSVLSHRRGGLGGLSLKDPDSPPTAFSESSGFSLACQSQRKNPYSAHALNIDHQSATFFGGTHSSQNGAGDFFSQNNTQFELKFGSDNWSSGAGRNNYHHGSAAAWPQSSHAQRPSSSGRPSPGSPASDLYSTSSNLNGNGDDRSESSGFDTRYGPWVDPVKESMRRRSQALSRADQGRNRIFSKIPPENTFHGEPDLVHVNPYAEYGRQVMHNNRDMHPEPNQHYGCGQGIGCANGAGSYGNYGMPNGHQQHGSRGGQHRGGRGNYQPDRPVHTNPYRSQPGRIQHIGQSFGNMPLPKHQSERMLVPRQELEMLSRFGETGGGPDQLDSPHGFCLGAEGEIIVADTMNNRIQIFDQKGTLIISWGTGGYRKGRLWQPRKVAFIEDLNRVVVSDRGRDCSRLQIFSRNGDFYSQIRTIRSTLFVGLTVYRGLVVAIENQPASCIIMTQEGKVLYQFTLEKIMEEPSDVLVVSDTFYICDFLGHCVCVFDSKGNLLQRIGSNFPGIIFYPNGIDVTDSGDVIVADTHGNRFHVSVWSPKGKLLADYELPHMKVSRCCGLFMTPEGNLITAATNNNIVLITNLLRVLDSEPTLAPLNEWPITFPECAEDYDKYAATNTTNLLRVPGCVPTSLVPLNEWPITFPECAEDDKSIYSMF